MSARIPHQPTAISSCPPARGEMGKFLRYAGVCRVQVCLQILESFSSGSRREKSNGPRARLLQEWCKTSPYAVGVAHRSDWSLRTLQLRILRGWSNSSLQSQVNLCDHCLVDRYEFSYICDG
jgi:hypothetical protein